MILDTNAQLIYLEAANEAKIAYIRGMDRVTIIVSKFRTKSQTIYCNNNSKLKYSNYLKMKFAVCHSFTSFRINYTMC